MLGKRTVVLIKTEVTYNTDPVPVEATDAVLVGNLDFNFAEARNYERVVAKPSLGALNTLYAGSLMSLSFDVEIKGSGAAGTVPELGSALRACGLGETIVVSTSVTYAPASSLHESVTIYLFEDGLRYILTGCRGGVTGVLQNGQPGILSFNFMGHFSGPTDLALANPTYNAAIPVAVLNLTGFSFDGFAAIVAALNFDMGTEIATPDDLSAADGFGEVTITGRKVTGSIDPLATLVASYDWVAKWKADTATSLATGNVGGVAGNIYNLSFPKAQIQEIGRGDRAGVLSRPINFLAGENVADDELSLAFT